MLNRRFTSKVLSLAYTCSLMGRTLATTPRVVSTTCLPRSEFTTYAPYTAVSNGYKETRRVSIFDMSADTSDVSSSLSPWHDIKLIASPSKGTFHYVNEIPKGTRAKMEIATKEPNNPIKQDVKNGKLRDLTYGKMPFNYGALPQTWENPLLVDPELGLKGDNDPLDVVEISTGPLPEGSVIEIKVLGALALLDEGEVDWKIIAVDANSPLAAKLNNAGDIENVMPGVVHDIREWFRLYKTSDGKPQNVFGHKEHILGLNETKAVIAGAHAEWRSLVTGKLGAEASALGLWTDAGAAAAEAEDAAAVADSAPTTVV